LNILHQIFCFVHNNLMHISCHLLTSVVRPMHYGIIFYVKKLQQLVPILIIGHGSTFRQQMKTNKKLSKLLLPFINNNMGNLINNRIVPNYHVQPFIFSMNQIFVHVIFTNFTNPSNTG
jgi:hypothetical protein